MKKLLFAIVCFTFFNSGCAFLSDAFTDNIDVKLKRKITTENIAVLNFTKLGTFQSTRLSKLAADNLTDKLFIIGNFNVIDRSRVNESIAKINILNPEVLSIDQIQQLGFKLKAEYIIIGSILGDDILEYSEHNNDTKLKISFRIISISDGEVIGMLNGERVIKSDIEHEIDILFNEMVEKLKESHG